MKGGRWDEFRKIKQSGVQKVCSFIVSVGWIILEHPHIMEPNEK